MDRQDIITTLSAIIKEDIRNDINLGIEKGIDHYLQRTDRELYLRSAVYNDRRNLIHVLDGNEVMKLWGDIKPEFTDMIDRYMQNCKKRKMTKDIKSTAANAVIKEAMDKAGLEYSFYGQAYRAKILFPVCKNRSIVFYLTYSKLHEQLPEVIESLKLIKRGMKGLGANVTISKTLDSSI